MVSLLVLIGECSLLIEVNTNRYVILKQFLFFPQLEVLNSLCHNMSTYCSADSRNEEINQNLVALDLSQRLSLVSRCKLSKTPPHQKCADEHAQIGVVAKEAVGICLSYCSPHFLYLNVHVSSSSRKLHV